MMNTNSGKSGLNNQIINSKTIQTMGNKKYEAIISLKLEKVGKESSSVESNVRGSQKDLFTILTSAMEHIEGFAAIVVQASEAYKSYQAKEQRKQASEEKGGQQ